MNAESSTHGKSEQRLVFVVEDDSEIAALISLSLAKAGFATRTFADGGSALAALPTQTPALILLDRMLPDMEGLEVLRLLKGDEALKHIKTMIVSARSSENDKVQALDMGVDDYLIKPFSPRELVARARAVLRSEQHALVHRVLQLGDMIADLDSRRVLRDGQEITISKREFDLLVYLMRNSGQTFSRRQLLERVWSDRWETLDGRMVDVYVRRLREKIEPDAANPTRLLTRRGDGYVMVVPR
jgi:DNA-binding response OmpR family regulator